MPINFLKENKKYKLIFVVFMVLLIIIIGIISAGAIYRFNYTDKVHPGIKLIEKSENKVVEGYLEENVSDRSTEKVKSYLKEALNPLNNKIIFEYEDNSWEYSLWELNTRYLIDRTVDDIIKKWKSEQMVNVLGDMFGFAPYEEEISILYETETEKTINRLENINETLKREPEDARFYIDKETGKLKIIESSPGKMVNIDKTVKALEELLEYNFGIFLKNNEVSISLVVDELRPEVTTKDLEEKEIEAIISSFETQFNPETEGRTYNINLASEYFYNLLIEPGSTISFNEVIAQAREEDAFKKAPIIVDMEFVDGIGGGVCQVSSTFYNAALKAGLNIVERHNHSRPIGYLPLGRDAAVAYDYLDLKVRNPYDHYLLVFAYTQGDKLVFKIFGHKDYEQLEKHYNIVSTDFEETSPPIEYVELETPEEDYKEKIQEGSPGYKISIWRHKIDEYGNIVEEEFLYTDRYEAVPTIYEIGKN